MGPHPRGRGPLRSRWAIAIALAIALAIAIAVALSLREDEPAVEEPRAETPRSGEPRPQMIALPGSVDLAGFEMCETEVSVEQYWVVTGERPSRCTAGCEADHPVNRVSWFDAVSYSNALTRRENRDRPSEPLTECYEESTWAWDRGCTGYRLPTEAEWEYAARAGTTTAWSFGDDAKDLCNYANVATVVSPACEDGFEGLAPVQTPRLRPNPWSLHAMHGNVWEWVYDWYDSESNYRGLRGGGFRYWPEFSQSGRRSGYVPEFADESVGFRCARGARSD